jgi:VWFA-related protein
LALLALLTLLGTAAGQNPAPSELTTTEVQPTFKLQVERNLVLVRVVVRDGKGKATPNLQKEDFKLFDNGRLQVITHFVVESPASKPAPQKNPAAEKQFEGGAPTEAAEVFSAPTRYTALFFDDVHSGFEDLVHARDAADRYLAAALQPSDRVGVFTVSGQGSLDFTDDRARIHESLFRLRPRPIVPPHEDPCPEILEYQAYQMVHERDPYAIEIATDETLSCRYNDDNRYLNQALNDAEGEAARILNFSETESEADLRGLEELIRRLAILPGQRNVVLVSPGFMTESLKMRVEEIIDRALRSNVIINTYDDKGLFAPIPLGDASKRAHLVPNRPDLTGRKAQLELTGLTKASQVLNDIALDTGGVFFHNSNDFDDGFRRVGALAEFYYVLGFSPRSLKYDGRYHSIKVSLVNSTPLTVQARRGYFAPRAAPDEVARAKEDIEQAVFSQDERNELPVEMHMQFFKTNGQEAKLSVLTHLDLRFISFRKKEGRNLDNLTVVTALFDRDGKYLTANEKQLELRLRNASLERLSRSGLNMKTSFDVKPGTYLVRQVVRDAEGGQLSGLSRTIEIPF